MAVSCHHKQTNGFVYQNLASSLSQATRRTTRRLGNENAVQPAATKATSTKSGLAAKEPAAKARTTKASLAAKVSILPRHLVEVLLISLFDFS